MPNQTLKSADELAKSRKPQIPGESQAYRTAREKLLAEEIEFRRHMTRLVEQRMALPPGPVVEKDYRFRDANGSDVGLIDLFGNHDVLVTYFWMYGPERERPCPMCTNWLGSVEGNAADIKQRVALKIWAVVGSSGRRLFRPNAGGGIWISCRRWGTTTRTIWDFCASATSTRA